LPYPIGASTATLSDMNQGQHNDGGERGFDPTLYPSDFFASRSRFLTTAQARGAEIFSYPLATNTPDLSEPLSIDIAFIGRRDAPHKILHIAGTHGVEGFIGSAIQHAIISTLRPPDDDCGIAFVHCLNPWGMAMLRRTNENNVDLNRNCLFDKSERSGAPLGYEHVRPLIAAEISSSFPAFTFRALRTVVQHGFSTMRQAITGGQYIDPQGVYFGGFDLQPEIVALQSWIQQSLSAQDLLTVIDLHSGLGKFCTDSLLIDDCSGSQAHLSILQRFPDEPIYTPDASESVTYTTRGSLGLLFHHTLPGACIDYVVHEFGTLHPFRVLHALVEENLHFFTGSRSRNNARLFEAFCPDSARWREYCVRRGVEIFRQARQTLPVARKHRVS
jgi:hypothetical protein